MPIRDSVENRKKFVHSTNLITPERPVFISNQVPRLTDLAGKQTQQAVPQQSVLINTCDEAAVNNSLQLSTLFSTAYQNAIQRTTIQQQETQPAQSAHPAFLLLQTVQNNENEYVGLGSFG